MFVYKVENRYITGDMELKAEIQLSCSNSSVTARKDYDPEFFSTPRIQEDLRQ